jgi:hypothetical protein
MNFLGKSLSEKCNIYSCIKKGEGVLVAKWFRMLTSDQNPVTPNMGSHPNTCFMEMD